MVKGSAPLHRTFATLADPLREATAWLSTYREFWTDRRDTFEHYLTEQEHDAC